MRIGGLVILSAVAVLLDAAIVPKMEILGARPDFAVLLVAYAGLMLGARPATIAGFVIGLIIDSEFPEYIGLNALALSAIGYVSALAWEHLVKGSIFVQIAVIFGASLMHDVIYYAVAYRNHFDMFWRFLMRYGLLGGAYTALFAACVYVIASALRWRHIVGGTRI